MKDHIYIIAEAGVNHNGDIGIAKRLVDEAAARFPARTSPKKSDFHVTENP